MDLKFADLTERDWPNWNIPSQGHSFVTLDGQHLQRVFNKIHTQLETLRTLSAEQGEQIQSLTQTDLLLTSQFDDLKITIAQMNKHIIECQMENQKFKSMNSELLCRVNLQDEYMAKIFQLIDSQNLQFQYFETRLKEIEPRKEDSKSGDAADVVLSTPITDDPLSLPPIDTSLSALEKLRSSNTSFYKISHNISTYASISKAINTKSLFETASQGNRIIQQNDSPTIDRSNLYSLQAPARNSQSLHSVIDGRETKTSILPISEIDQRISLPSQTQNSSVHIPKAELQTKDNEARESEVKENLTGESLSHATNPAEPDDITVFELPDTTPMILTSARSLLDPKLHLPIHSDSVNQVLMEQLDQQIAHLPNSSVISRPSSATTSQQLRYDVLLNRLDNFSKDFEYYQDQTSEELKLMKYKWNKRFQEMHDWILEHVNGNNMPNGFVSNQSQDQILNTDKIATLSIFQCPECYRLSKSTLTEEGGGGLHLHSTSQPANQLNSQTKRKKKLSQSSIDLPSYVNNSRECTKHRIDIKASEVWWNMVQR